jgi:4-hydroxybutyrate dehydrogenase
LQQFECFRLFSEWRNCHLCLYVLDNHMARITYLTAIDFGCGEVGTLPQALTELGIKRPLLVSDHGVAAAGLLDAIRRMLPLAAPLFLDVPPNPNEKACLEATKLYKDQGCDGVVALGGGSPIDLAKGVALLGTHAGPLEQYALVHGGLGKITSAIAPVIAIPTTAGTGSEVGRAALLTLDDDRKLGFISPHLIPKRAICDPELTVGLPPALTAATGLDALSHCIETYLSPRDNPPADAIALDGAGRIWRNIRTVFDDGANIAARSEMMMGALQGGLCFQKGLGAIHSLSHALGGLKDLRLHHGTLNAILMPIVVRFNASSSTQKIAALSNVLGLATGEDLVQALDDINGTLGIPRKLGALGVKPDMLDWIVERALVDHSHATNPRSVSAEDYKNILKQALN